MKKQIAFLLAVGLFLVGKESPCSRTLYEGQSLYHYIRVEESGTVRTLRFRQKGISYDESKVDTAEPMRLVMRYSRLMFAGFLFVPEPKRVLVVGLGGGTLSGVISHYFPKAKVDSVELDPEVLKIAKNYFLFRDGGNLRVYIRDGRVHIKSLVRRKAKYDIIMLDAFRGGYIPYHLTTKEFLQECRNILAPGGVVVANLWDTSRLYEYQRRTFARVFESHYAFGGGGNKILAAIPRKVKLSKKELSNRAKELQKKREFSFQMTMVVEEYDPRIDYPTRGQILVDGHAPANVLRSQPLR
ncbi:fused MFS/spermidine synthase [bacterium]|nr:fused MFS/spermidine synthase [bacterium]